MKQHKPLLSLLLIPILFFLLTSHALTAFATDSENDLVTHIEGALDVSVFHKIEAERLIKCFDVNEDGYYAIGYRNNTIHVYNALGQFQYGYHFSTDGTYGISLKENSIVIYLGRSHIAAEIDASGKCIGAQTVHFSKDFVNNILYRMDKQIGKDYYFLERDVGIFSGDYSRLVKIDEEGTKTVLYDLTTRGYFAGVTHYLILSIFPIGGIMAVIQKVKDETYESDV